MSGAVEGVALYCRNCDCARCREQRERRSNAAAIARDEASRCWSCSCGWMSCYTRADIRKYGEPSECNRCHRERLEECDQPAPVTTPPARSYADGLEFEEAATIADAFAEGQQRMIDEEGPDEACRGGKEVAEFIANAIRRRAGIRLLSQGGKA